jgi:hypothetical protein
MSNEGVDQLRAGLATALETVIDAEEAAAAAVTKAKEAAALASETVRVIDDYTGMVRTTLYVLRDEGSYDDAFWGRVTVVTADDDAECLALVSKDDSSEYSRRLNEKLVRNAIRTTIMIKPEDKGYLTRSKGNYGRDADDSD